MNKRTTRFLSGTLLVLALSACGQQTGGNAMAGMDHSTMSGMSTSPSASTTPNNSGTMAGMASPSASTAPSMLPGMSGMDHSTMGGMMSTATSTVPFDALFIDGMVEHHQGAVTMAEQALQEAERSEIKQLAQTIIDTQEQEITQMTGWREQWYAALAPTGGMSMDMGDMNVSADASTPFDQRFMQAMIGHHQGAINMARQAQQAEHAEIKQLAGTIITTQEQEIGQMRQWLQAWYGVV